MKKGFNASSTSDFAGFDTIRSSDQEKLKAKLADKLAGGGGGGTKRKKGGGKKATGPVLPPLPPSCPELKIEYAKSSRSSCRKCEEKIPKEDVRMAVMGMRESEGMPAMVVPWW